MFTEIGIENFKAFGKMQRIPLKPITLLYGPNSAGKSSLMQSLLLFKQTIEESGDDQIVLLPKGDLVDLGSYQQFIHGQDSKHELKISISFKYPWELEDWYWPVWDNGDNPDLSMEFSFFQDKAKEILLKSIKISESFHTDPIVEWKNIWMFPSLRRAIQKRMIEFENDGESKEEIDEWVSMLKRSIIVMDHINLGHPYERYHWNGFEVLSDGGYGGPNDDCKENTDKEIEVISKYLKEEYQEIVSESAKLNSENSKTQSNDLKERQKDLNIRKAKFQQLKKILKLTKAIHAYLINASYDKYSKINHFPVSGRLISMANCFTKDNYFRGDEELFYKIPDIAGMGEPVTYPKIIGEEIAIPTIYIDLTASQKLLSRASSKFKEYLRRITYIGPMREFPERIYTYMGNVPSNVGKSGKYMPDILKKKPHLVSKVNDWFKKFDIDYELNVPDLDRKGNYFSLSLKDKKTDIKVSHKDVGFGIGQLLPILVQGVLSENKIILIEQPEIHVHPRLQAELGSFIAEVAGRSATKPPEDHYDMVSPEKEKYGNQFIIETHSEHLVLRLLRLIRDTTNGELKEGEKPLRPEDVAVIYAKPTEHGTELMELRISEDGDFIDKWPDGFFTERAKELF
jgi:predicted ATPase